MCQSTYDTQITTQVAQKRHNLFDVRSRVREKSGEDRIQHEANESTFPVCERLHSNDLAHLMHAKQFQAYEIYASLDNHFSSRNLQRALEFEATELIDTFRTSWSLGNIIGISSRYYYAVGNELTDLDAADSVANPHSRFGKLLEEVS